MATQNYKAVPLNTKNPFHLSKLERKNTKIQSSKFERITNEEWLWEKHLAKEKTRKRSDERRIKSLKTLVLDPQSAFSQEICGCGRDYHNSKEIHDCSALKCHRVQYANPFHHKPTVFEEWAARRMWRFFEERHFTEGNSYIYDEYTYSLGQADVLLYIVHCQFPRGKYYRVASFGHRHVITRVEVYHKFIPEFIEGKGELPPGLRPPTCLTPQWGFDLNHKIDLSGTTDFVDQICAKLQIFASSIDWKSIVTSGLLCLTNIWYNWDRPATIMLSIGQFLMTLKLAQSVLDGVLELFRSYYDQARDAVKNICDNIRKTNLVRKWSNEKFLHIGEPTDGELIRLAGQANFHEQILSKGLDATALIRIVGGAASTLLVVTLLGYLPGGEKFDTTFNRFAKTSGIIRSYDEVAKVGESCFTTIWDTVSHRVFGFEKKDMDEWKNINNWITEVNSLMIPDFENTIKGNEVMKQTVESLLTRGLNILRLLDLLKVPMQERTAVTQCIMFLTRARETAGNCGAGQTKPRVAPAIIHFFGNSGVGKSTTLWALIAELQAALGVTKASDLHEKTYFKRPGGKFWDGYNNGINVTVCDDFGALKDTPAAPNPEFLEAIHMSNTAFWQLNMAELSEKRNTTFNSKVVLWTSNRSRFAVESLTNPEAVIRRVNLKIRQRPHPRFAKTDIQDGEPVQILDSKKVDNAIAKYGKSAIFGCLLFDIIDKDCPNDTPLEIGLSFEEIARRCVDVMKRSISSFESFHEHLEHYIVDAIERSKDGEWQPPVRGDFDPDTCLLDPQFGLQDVKRFFTPDVHVSLKDVKGRILPVFLGAVSDEDKSRLAGIGRSDCYFVPPYQREAFANCIESVESAFFYVDDEMQTDEVYLNLFVQAEKAFQCRFDVPLSKVCARCAVSSRIDQLRKRIAQGTQRCEEYVQSKFGITPTRLALYATGATIIFGLVASFMYKKIFKKIQTLTNEKYDTDRTNSQKAVRIAESYATDVTKGKPNRTIAEQRVGEKASKGPAVPVTSEFYSDVTKGRPTIKTEGWFSSSPCLPHGVASGYCQVCDNACAGGHGNLRDYCYACDPTWYARLGIESQQRLCEQACVDQNAAEVVNVVYRNMYKLECFLNEKWEHAVNILIVKGRLAIMNRHVLSRVDSESRWRIRNGNFQDGIEFPLADCPMYYVPDDDNSAFGFRDVCMIELPRLVHQHVDITSKFMDTFDFGRFKQLQQISVIGYIPDPKIMVRQYFGSDSMADDSQFVIGRGDDPVKVRTLFKYNIQTVSGDCGAVLVAFDKNFHNKIFGIHCAGLSDPHYQGYGTPVTRNFLQYLERNLVCANAEATMSPPTLGNEGLQLEVNTCMNGRNMWSCVPRIEGNFYPVGTDSKRLFQGTETKILPSPVHGVIQVPTMAPAVLKPVHIDGQFVDPMRNARMKASPVSPPLDLQILEECANDFFQMIGSSDRDQIILTYEQAITGIEGDDCYPPIKRSTSPGYGWEKKGKGKTHWLGEDEYVLDNVELRAKYDELLDKCKAGIRPGTVWCDTLKDERRSLDKIAAAKTRLFSCGEMAFTILFRQYFGGYIAHMTRNKIDVESCVGVNVYSLDWSRIVQKLQQVGRKVLAGDFTNYDGTLHPDILWIVLDGINEWDNAPFEVCTIRRAIWSEIVNSIHLVDNVFYMWNHSQPSGCPMTTVLNCSYHSISARYVYLECARRNCPEKASLDFFRSLIRHFNYGDDDVWSIADEIVAWFNQVTISEAYSRIGMKYTDEAKSGELVPYRELCEIDFLKRKFRWDSAQCRYRAPLALATVREMPMWNHGSVDQYVLTATILQDAVRELAQHDESVFDVELPAFKRAAEVIRKRVPVFFKTYQQYQIEEAIKLL